MTQGGKGATEKSEELFVVNPLPELLLLSRIGRHSYFWLDATPPILSYNHNFN